MPCPSPPVAAADAVMEAADAMIEAAVVVLAVCVGPLLGSFGAPHPALCFGVPIWDAGKICQILYASAEIEIVQVKRAACKPATGTADENNFAAFGGMAQWSI